MIEFQLNLNSPLTTTESRSTGGRGGGFNARRKVTFSPEMNAPFKSVPEVLYWATIPFPKDTNCGTRRWPLPSRAKPQELSSPEIRLVFIGVPDEAYTPTVPLP